MGWGLLKSWFKISRQVPCSPFLLRIHAFDFAAASSPRTRDWPGCASWLLGWSVWPVVQTKNIFNIGIQCSYYWSWNVILWQVLCVVLPLLWNKMCTCESLVKKLWGIANLFPIAFPSKEGPAKEKLQKGTPPPRGGVPFWVFFYFWAMGNKQANFKWSPAHTIGVRSHD